MTAAIEAVLGRFLPQSPLTAVLKTQFAHVDWAGLHFEDLIFPLFLFISGAAMAFSVPRRLERETQTAVIKHLIVRALVIFGHLRRAWRCDRRRDPSLASQFRQELRRRGLLLSLPLPEIEGSI